MARKPPIPTGEKAPPQYTAPLFVPTDPNEQQRFLGSQFSAIADALKALQTAVSAAPRTTALQATGGPITAHEGDTIRVSPRGSTSVVLLPTARAANKGDEVAILVESPGTVIVRAVDSLVQNAVQVTLTGIGLRVMRSDGGNGQTPGGWWIVGENSGATSSTPGPQGAPGSDGADGTDGQPGLPGAPGGFGPPVGPQGLDGADGDSSPPILAISDLTLFDDTGAPVASGVRRLTGLGMRVTGAGSEATLDTLPQTTVVNPIAGGTLNAYPIPATVKNGDTLIWVPSGNITLNGILATGVPSGFRFTFQMSSTAFTVTLNSENASAAANDRLSLPDALSMFLTKGVTVTVQRASTRWFVVEYGFPLVGSSLVYNGRELDRAALTGFATAAQDSNALVSAEPLVAFSASANMSNERVLSNGVNTTVNIATPGIIAIDVTTAGVGAQGPPGLDGKDGEDGLDGVPGIPGPQGLNGTNGTVGPQGPPGTDGADGADGLDGIPGLNGSTGATGATGATGSAGFTIPANDGESGADTQVIMLPGTPVLPLLSITESAAGPFNDYAIPSLANTDFILVASAATQIFTGFACAGGNQEGYRFKLLTGSTASGSLTHNSASSLAANRIFNGGNVNLDRRARDLLELEYFTSGWRVMNHTGTAIQSNATAERVSTEGGSVAVASSAGMLITAETGTRYASSPISGKSGLIEIVPGATISTPAANITALSAGSAVQEPLLVGTSAIRERVGYSITDGRTANLAQTAAITNITISTVAINANGWVAAATQPTAFLLSGRFLFNHAGGAATPTITIEALINAAVQATVVMTPVTATAAFGGEVQAVFTCRAIGATASAFVNIACKNNFGSALVDSYATSNNSIVAGTFDSTAASSVTLRIRMTTAVASNVLTVTEGFGGRIS